jgi:antitoxin VapB
MIEVDSKTFKSGNSEAVRLPKEVAFGANVEVTIRKIGDTLEITPKAKRKMTPAEMVAKLREIGPPPGPKPKRQKIIFPKRRGL